MADLTIEQRKALAMAAARLRLKQQQAGGQLPGKSDLPTDTPFPTPNIGAKGAMRPGDVVPTDVTGQAGQAMTFNLGDEAVAGMRVPVDMAVNAATGQGPTDPGEVWQQIRAFQNAQNARTQEQKPIASTIAGVTGALATAPAVAGKALQGGNLLTKSGKAALTGAAMGGAAGFGAGEGLDDRISGAATGAGTGAAIGAVLPSAGVVAGQAYRGARTLGRAATAPLRSLADKETFAAGKVAEALKRDQMTPERLAGRLASNQAVKGDLVAADVAGKNTQSLLRAANNVPSEARDKLTRSLFQRQEKQLDRLRADIGAAYGKPEDFHSTVEQLTVGRQRAAKPLFDMAFRTPTPYTQELEGVLNRPLTKQLVERARTAAANRGEKFKSVFVKVNKNGTIHAMRVPDTEGLHRVKMEIDSAINGLKNRTETGLGNVQLRDLTILKKDLLGAIDNPTYKGALKQYAGDSASVNALQDGFDEGLSMEPELISKTLAGMSNTEAELWRLGFARRVVNQLRDSGRSGANRAEILHAPKFMDRMKAAFSDSRTGREFMQKLNLERRMFRTRQAVEGNSTTAQQLAEGQEAGVEAEAIRQNTSLAGSIFKGDLGSAFLNLISRAKNSATGLRPEVADEIVRLLTTKSPGDMLKARSLITRETNKLNSRQATPGKISQGVGLGGFGAIPALPYGGQ